MNLSIFPVLALFIVTVLCSVFQETGKATCAKKYVKNPSQFYLFNAILSVFSIFVVFVLSGFRLQGSVYTVILGLCFGLFIMGSNVSSTMAVRTGPWSYTRVIITSSTVFTALSGWLFWNETLKWTKIAGIFLMFLCCCFAVDKGKKEEKNASKKWFILCVVAMVFATLVGITQKTHQKSYHKSELTVFLMIAFAVSAISSFMIYLFTKKKEDINGADEKDGKTHLLWMIVCCAAICGVFSAGNHVINLYLSGVVDSSIMFPIVNGIPLILNVMLSFLLFKEKLTPKQWIGFALGCLSVAFLCV